MNEVKRKLHNNESGLKLYSLTPPRATISNEDLERINKRRIERISRIPFDGLSLYDVQEENFRNDDRRTYEYRPAMNPLRYGKSLTDLSEIPQLFYLVAGKYSEEELFGIFREHDQGTFVLVGSPDSRTPGKTSLNRAYDIASRANVISGAVLIGERQRNGKSEVDRVMEKIRRGADFFVSQCIYNSSLYEKFLYDYAEESARSGQEMRPVIMTFAPVGRKKDLDFMKWLGVDIPGELQLRAMTGEDILHRTMDHLEKAAESLIRICRDLNIPFGLNFESVIARGREIHASLDLAERVSAIMERSLQREAVMC